MDRDQLITTFGDRLLRDADNQHPGWEDLVLAARFVDNQPQMSGITYDKQGQARPISPRDFELLDVVTDLRKAMAKVDKEGPWVAALFKIRRADEEINGEFEYDDPDKWAITTSNYEKRIEEFRPNKVNS